MSASIRSIYYMLPIWVVEAIFQVFRTGVWSDFLLFVEFLYMPFKGQQNRFFAFEVHQIKCWLL